MKETIKDLLKSKALRVLLILILLFKPF